MPLFRKVQPPFSLKTLVKDSNCVLIQDPSAIWGGADHLPRRNLLTYSEDFTASAWTIPGLKAFGSGSTANAVAGPSGYGMADLLVEDTSTGLHRILQSVQYPNQGIFRFNVVCKYAGRHMRIVAQTPSENPVACINLQTGAVISGTPVVVDLGGGWYHIAVATTIAAIPNGYAQQLTMCDAVGTFVYTGDGVSGFYVAAAWFTLTSTTDQSYQKITDWTTEQYAWAATKNVPWLRRNRLEYTNTLDAAFWTKLSGVTITTGQTDHIGGTSAVKLTCSNTATNTKEVYKVGLTQSVGSVQYGECKFKAGEFGYAILNLYDTSNKQVWFNLSTGAVGTKDASITASITSLGDDWYLCKAYRTVTGGTNLGLDIQFSNADNVSSFTGIVGSGVYAANPLLSVGAIDYQRIATTWPAEYTSLAIAAGYPISLYSDRAGTTATVGPDDPVGKLLDLSGDNNHATAPSDAARPNLRLDGNGKFYLDRDTTDDDLPITWPTNLTTTGVIYTATGDYTTKDSGLTLSGLTSYKYPQRPSGDYGRIVMAAESKYDAKIIKYLDQKRGRSYQLGPELVTNGSFSTDANWVKVGVGATISDGVANIVSDGTATGIYQTMLTVGKPYRVSFDVRSFSGTARILMGNGASGAGVFPLQSVGSFSVVLTCTGTDGVFMFYRVGACNVSLDNVSVMEILL